MARYVLGDSPYMPLVQDGETYTSGTEIELSDFDFERLSPYFSLTPADDQPAAAEEQSPPDVADVPEAPPEPQIVDETSSDAETISTDEPNDGTQASADPSRTAGSRRLASES